MKYAAFITLNCLSYCRPHLVPGYGSRTGSHALFQKVTKGSLSGKGREEAKEDFKINGQYVVYTLSKALCRIPFFDGYVEKAATEFVDEAARTTSPSFLSCQLH